MGVDPCYQIVIIKYLTNWDYDGIILFPKLGYQIVTIL
jgi:hypothetical protein